MSVKSGLQMASMKCVISSKNLKIKIPAKMFFDTSSKLEFYPLYLQVTTSVG